MAHKPMEEFVCLFGNSCRTRKHILKVRSAFSHMLMEGDLGGKSLKSHRNLLIFTIFCPQNEPAFTCNYLASTRPAFLPALFFAPTHYISKAYIPPEHELI